MDNVLSLKSQRRLKELYAEIGQIEEREKEAWRRKHPQARSFLQTIYMAKIEAACAPPKVAASYKTISAELQATVKSKYGDVS